MVLLEVTCPDGVGPGDMISVERPSDGASFDVEVPAGVEAGTAFNVEVPEDDALAAAVENKRLTPEDEAALRSIEVALRPRVGRPLGPPDERRVST